MTNDQSNSMPLDQRLFHKPHILVRSTLHFQPREGCPAIGTVDHYPILLKASELLNRNAPVVINPLLPVAPRKVFQVSNHHCSYAGEDIGQGGRQ
jgi:hypothetical protein